MSRSADGERELVALYGALVDWSRATGVVHVAAIGGRRRAALAVGPDGFASSTDRFILGFARARADAIVTTSAILRAEPELVHRTSEDPAEEERWRHFRSTRLGRPADPDLIVLSHRGELPADHPALRRPGRVVVVTSALGRARVAESARSFEIEVLADPAEPSPRVEAVEPACRLLSRTIRWLREERGSETIVLEAGPRSTFGLYAGGASRAKPLQSGSAGAGAPREDPETLARVDELLLSVFEGDRGALVPGPALASRAELIRYFGGGSEAWADEPGAGSPLRSECLRAEASGPWRFERYRRVEARP